MQIKRFKRLKKVHKKKAIDKYRDHDHHAHRKHDLTTLIIASIGIVYGDIGTSPLYTVREIFHGLHPLALTAENIFGATSMIFWSLMFVVTFKYISVMMSIDNQGEGGIMALLALNLRKSLLQTPRQKKFLIAIGLFGAALFYGDGLLTPAISVLSAIEGLQFATPVFTPFIIPITITVLIALFLIQQHGTARVGAWFGPIMTIWFTVIAITGILGIINAPGILLALDPRHAISFIVASPKLAFFSLSTIVLAITGAEALYSDMGHFGKRPIRLAWLWFVLPALTLNYLGQGALLLVNEGARINPFYMLVPKLWLYPMVLLATIATIIASQAVISGLFSITRQAIQLGYCPPLDVFHTSSKQIGQIFIPWINYAMLILVIGIVLSFRTSSHLAAAYGISVTGTMTMTSILALAVIPGLGKKSTKWLFGLVSLFLIVDLLFFTSNLSKFFDGGWFPIAIGLFVFFILSTWKTGRDLLLKRLQEDSIDETTFMNDIEQHPPLRVPGTAIFLTASNQGIPRALLHNWYHNKVLHERVILMTINTKNIPFVRRDKRLEIHSLGNSFFRITVWYGFKEPPNVPKILEQCTEYGLQFNMQETSFFLGRAAMVATKRPGMAIWREKLFITLANNTRHTAAFFKVPANRIIELGTQVEI